MSTISAIDTLQAILDGDTLVPGMNFVLPSGVGTTQYYNPATQKCTPDWKNDATKRITLYPAVYSSSSGRFLVPDPNSWQWYEGNPDSSAAAILTTPGGTTVVSSKNTKYQATTYTINGQTFPALKIINDLASATNLNDVTIYFKATFNGMDVTSHATITIKQAVGDIFDILINCVNEDGANDTVIDNDSEYLILTADFQNAGSPVTPSGGWSWMKMTATGLVPVTHVSGVSELSNSNKTLKLFDGGIEGTEEYFACCVHNGVTHRKAIQVSDTHDPYYINIGRSTNTNLVKEGDTITYTPAVVRRQDGAVQTGWTFAYVSTDNDGAVKKSSTGNTYTLTGVEVKANGELHTMITATKV